MDRDKISHKQRGRPPPPKEKNLLIFTLSLFREKEERTKRIKMITLFFK